MPPCDGALSKTSEYSSLFRSAASSPQAPQDNGNHDHIAQLGGYSPVFSTGSSRNSGSGAGIPLCALLSCAA